VHHYLGRGKQRANAIELPVCGDVGVVLKFYYSLGDFLSRFTPLAMPGGFI
jgi:hypothetical protein